MNLPHARPGGFGEVYPAGKKSTGGNETASRYSGTNTTLVRILVYVIAGICSGVAGIIFTADVQSADAAFIGLWIELEAILAVVIGGTLMSGG